MIKNCFIPNKKNKYKPYLLRKIAIVSYTFILLFVNSFGGFLGITEVRASTITSANIISLTNQERVAWGLNSLETNAQLSAAALAKANDMFEKQYWDHFGPNGESPWQFIRGAGYNYVYAGENLAKGFKTAEGVHEAWMASPTHKANIISGNYKDIGVAVVEGVLLGKQTTLVVQMFGNLTSEVYGAAQAPVEEENKATTPTSEKKVVVNNETGEIKSIRITHPQESAYITDPSMNVKGEVSNVSGSYTVDIYEGNEIAGSTTTQGDYWEISRDSDWTEGTHSILANIKEYNVKSDVVSFTVDSKAPLVDLSSIVVEKEENTYKLSFLCLDTDLRNISIVLGSETLLLEYENTEGNISTSFETSKIGTPVILVLDDENGNTSEIDITEYFVEESNQKSILPIFRLGVGDTISIALVSFVLLLLVIEVFVLWRKGRIKDAVNDAFTIGAWWLILSVAIFNGFSGVIN